MNTYQKCWALVPTALVLQVADMNAGEHFEDHLRCPVARCTQIVRRARGDGDFMHVRPTEPALYFGGDPSDWFLTFFDVAGSDERGDLARAAWFERVEQAKML